MHPGQLFVPTTDISRVKKWHQLLLTLKHNKIATEINLDLKPKLKEPQCACTSLPHLVFWSQMSEPWRCLLLPTPSPSLTRLTWPGCCISFQKLYNLETCGLFQGSHWNLRYFYLISGTTGKTLKVRVWYLWTLDLFGQLEGRKEWIKRCAQPVSASPVQRHIKY